MGTSESSLLLVDPLDLKYFQDENNKIEEERTKQTILSKCSKLNKNFNLKC